MPQRPSEAAWTTRPFPTTKQELRLRQARSHRSPRLWREYAPACPGGRDTTGAPAPRRARARCRYHRVVVAGLPLPHLAAQAVLEGGNAIAELRSSPAKARCDRAVWDLERDGNLRGSHLLDLIEHEHDAKVVVH